MSESEIVSYMREPLDSATVHDSQAVDLESELLLSGKFVPVIGDDEAHISGHGSVVDSEAFRQATSQGQIALLMHLAGHVNKRAGGPVRIEQRRE